MDQRPQLRIGRRVGVDDDLLGLQVAPPAGRAAVLALGALMLAGGGFGLS